MSSAAQKKQNLSQRFRDTDFREVFASLLLRYGWTKRCEKLLAIFWFCAAISIFLAFSTHFPAYTVQDLGREGSYLFYGMKNASSFYMPMLGIINTAKDLCPGSAQFLINTGFYLLILPLSYALSVMLHSRPAGALAVLISCALLVFLHEYGDLEQRLLSITLLGFAFYSASDELSPALSKKIAAGVMLGCSFLVRSTMAFFPFLWCGYKLLREEKGHRRECFKKILPVLAIPFLMLVPWIIYMRLVHGTYTLFENGRANSNIITGALGLVGTIEGDTNKLAQLHGWHPGASVLLWAVKQVCLHPVLYAGAVLTRLGEVFWMHPLLITGGTAGFIICRKNPAARMLALLILYLAGIHCLMTIEPRYFSPLWLLCAPLAAFFILSGMKTKTQVLSRLAAIPCALIALCALLTLAMVIAYPFRAARDNGDISARARGSRDYWLWKLAAFQSLSNGDIVTTTTMVGKVISLNPEASYKTLRMLSIYNSLVISRHDPLIARMLLRHDFELADMLISADKGDDDCKRKFSDFSSAFLLFRHFNAYEASIYREMKNTDRTSAGGMFYTDGYQDVQLALRDRLARCVASPAPPPTPDSGFNTSDIISVMAMNLQETGCYRTAAILFHLTVFFHPHNAGMRTNLGVVKGLRGDITGAEKEFRHALELDPSFAPAKISLEWTLSRQPAR